MVQIYWERSCYELKQYHQEVRKIDVYNKSHCKTAKFKGKKRAGTSKRKLNKLWQQKVINLIRLRNWMPQT